MPNSKVTKQPGCSLTAGKKSKSPFTNVENMCVYMQLCAYAAGGRSLFKGIKCHAEMRKYAFLQRFGAERKWPKNGAWYTAYFRQASYYNHKSCYVSEKAGDGGLWYKSPSGTWHLTDKGWTIANRCINIMFVEQRFNTKRNHQVQAVTKTR